MKLLVIIVFLNLLASISQAQVCGRQLFEKDLSPGSSQMSHVIEAKTDFVMQDFPYNSNFMRFGCGAACAINVLNSVYTRLGLGLEKIKSSANEVMHFANKYFVSNVFGTHAASSIPGFHVGNLAQLLDDVLISKKLDTEFSIHAYQKSPHEPYLRGEANIQFIKNMQEMDPFFVSSNISKVVLIEVSNSYGNRKEYLSAHFYTVVSTREGHVTLHDPLIKGSAIEFELRPYYADGYPTYMLVPTDPSYRFAVYDTSGLHFMLNGFVSVEIK